MTKPGTLPDDFEDLLMKAGAEWRSAQVFGHVDVPSGKVPAVRRQGQMRRSDALGVIAVAVVAIGVLLLGLPRLGEVASDPAPPTVGPSVTGIPTPSRTPAPSATDEVATPAESISPAAAEAIRLAVIEAVHADQENFGGIYLEEDLLVIQYIGSNVGRPAVDEILRSRVPVRWQQVRWPRAELERIAREIAARYLGDLPGVWGVGIDTENNQVSVRVGPTGSIEEVAALLAREYGDIVSVVPGDPVVAL
jgi:hypothetical protein